MDGLAYIVLLVALGGLVIWLVGENRKLQRQYKNLHKLHADLSSLYDSLKSKTDPLWQYQGIHKVDLEIAKRKEQIKQYTLAVKLKAEEIINNAKAESRDIRSKVRAFVEKSKTNAAQTIELAKSQAATIVSSAETSAREIAGSALDAKNRADEYEKTAKAMKNLIMGYGDEYLIPNVSTLDELAEDFSHKEAGQQLATARNQTRSMITHEVAATCDYADNYRRKTAIEFVLDAFNGKVDSILTNVRHDNYGKLAQQIKDAFQTVNHNGTAFRNARITDLYLANRLNELKWAVATHELKMQEKEEQRQIREQMRDEERALKEYEKAIKEAEKEEKILQKAMTKARQELELANEEERAKFEAQLMELQQQLEEAEAKNQRALSMAQQTRRGNVYVISNTGSFGQNVFKIGMTRRLEPLDRIKELGDASVPFDFDVHAIINTEDAPQLEKELHNCFDNSRVNKVNTRKEFFSVNLAEVRKVIEDLGIQAHWTMKAEAIQFRESNAMAQTMRLVVSKSA